MPRPEAEKKFGFRLYQGGAVPGRDIRVVEIPDFDVEACGGVHCEATGEVERIKIIAVRRIQDGIIRFEFVAGNRLCSDAAEAAKEGKQHELKEWEQHYDKALAEVNELRAKLKKPLVARKLPKTMLQLTEKWKELNKELECLKKDLACAAADKPFQYIPNVDMRILENIGRSIVSKDPKACSLLVSEGVVFACRGEKCECNVEAAAKEAARVMGGSAGGRDPEWRGGGPLRDRARDAFEAAKKLLKAK
jgi:alanyl-tRNA synthetase